MEDEMQVIRSDELPLSMIPKKKQIAHGVVPLCRGSVNAIANFYEKAATTERVASTWGVGQHHLSMSLELFDTIK